MIPPVTPKFWLAAMGCLLLPVWAPGESNMGSDSQRSMQVATAHLKFKIVIPQVLSLEIVDAGRAGALALAISGNDQKVYRVSASGRVAHHSLILSGAGHRSIAQFASCDTAPAVPLVSCTVSMP